MGLLGYLVGMTGFNLDPTHPMRVRYQAAPHPELTLIDTIMIVGRIRTCDLLSQSRRDDRATLHPVTIFSNSIGAQI